MRLDRRDALKWITAGAGVPALAAPVLAAAAPAAARVGDVQFLHGVASGDPLQDRVILWTRATPAGDLAMGELATGGQVSVSWVVAEDPALARIAARGQATTGPERDYTVKLDVGGLKPGRDYWYAFEGPVRSPVGRTRTLPVGHLEELTLAFVTCALYPNGYFNAYDHIARSEKLDAVVELGDYIYEYGAKPDDYGMANGEKLGRLPEPPHDLLSLADYRIRYAQYRRDVDLQAAHARAPWICVWDDHEVCNDTWVGGGENHHEKTEGPFDARKAHALQAYFEWMPIREPGPGHAVEAIYRNFDFGDLASLTMLESRLLARSYQLEYDRAGDVPFVLYESTDPANRKRVTDPATAAAVLARTPTGGEPPTPYSFGPDVEAVNRYISDPARQMLGSDQEAWLQAALDASVKAGRPWQVVGNQVIMGRCQAPKIAPLIGAAGIAALLAKLPPAQRKEAARLIDICSYPLPYDLDGWDGYPAARARMDAIFQAAGGGNPIVVSGDSHAFWVNQLHDAAGAKRVALEFGTSAITSPSIGDGAGGFQLGQVFMLQNPEVTFCDQLAKGYVRLTLRHDEAVGELVEVQIDAKPYKAGVLSTWRLRPTQEPGVAPIERL